MASSRPQTDTAADEWISNGSRRRYCSRIILQPQPNGEPPSCWLCGQPGADSVDHVKPRAKYPELTWELANMRPAHKACNSAKGSNEVSRDLGTRSRRW